MTPAGERSRARGSRSVVRFIAAATALLAQTAASTPVLAEPAPTAATAGSTAGREQRFVEAVQASAAGANDGAGERRNLTAYVMVDLPPIGAAADSEPQLAIELLGINGDALAKFYSDVCATKPPKIDPTCARRRITITTSQKLPPAQACHVLQGALIAACGPAPAEEAAGEPR